MAEDAGKDSKTEEPSEKKVSDALKKGNVPHSREPAIVTSLLAMFIIAAVQMGDGAFSVSAGLSAFLERPEQWDLEDGAIALQIMRQVALLAFQFLIPVFAIFIAAALVASFSQNMPRIVLHRIRPDPSRISPGKGLKRLLGAQGRVEFLKAVFKFSAISVIVAILLKSEAGRIMTSVLQSPALLPAILRELALKLLSAVALAAIVLAGADYVWARRHWWANLRMTRQEVKDERKELDGDPIVKARRLSLARDRLRKSMMAAIPQATVVIANPTHYSVALRYDRERDAAPVVIAKGQNLIALKIREIAQEHGIPVMENRSLARALHAQTQINQLIPEEFYPAVAEIIHYVHAMRNG